MKIFATSTPCALSLAAIATLTLLGGPSAHTQEALTTITPPSMTHQQRADLQMNAPVHTFHLKYASEASDANEIYTTLRNVLPPDVKSFLVADQRAIVVRALPDDLAIITQLLAELDKPKAAYRLTYTITQFDGTQRLSTQHYAIPLVDGQQATLKLGDKVPVQTGKYDSASATNQTQMTYLDTGLIFDATPDAVDGGVMLKSVVDQSAASPPSVNSDKSAPATQDPTIHQTSLRGIIMVPFNKPTSLGTLDTPGTTRHQEIAVTLEQLP